MALWSVGGKTWTMAPKLSNSTVELLRAAQYDDDADPSNRLADQVHRGVLLRLRRGVYVDAQSWLEAPRWRRFDLTVAAEAQAGASPLFCRETALLLHGLPVLELPSAVQLRTAGRGRVTTLPEVSLTGRLSAAQYLRRCAEGPDSARSTSAEAELRNIRKKYVEPALPAGMSRPELRSAVTRGSYTNPEVLLPTGALHGIAGPSEGYRTEPVGLAVVDTVSRLPFTDAVVVLDAVKARGDIDVGPWLRYLRTKRQRRRWERAWSFADARAESALESESRALLHELGLPAPTLQRVVHTRIGTFRLDMCWEDEGVAGEVDGRSKYFDQQYTGGQDAHEIHYAEKQRREAVEEDGWQVVRWGKEQVRHPEQLLRRLGRHGVVPQ